MFNLRTNLFYLLTSHIVTGLTGQFIYDKKLLKRYSAGQETVMNITVQLSQGPQSGARMGGREGVGRFMCENSNKNIIDIKVVSVLFNKSLQSCM